MPLQRRQQAAQLLREFIGAEAAEPVIQTGRDLVSGFKKGEQITRGQAGPAGTRRTTVLGPEFNRLVRKGGSQDIEGRYNLATGSPKTQVIEPAKNAAEMLGAYTNRLLVDVGSDSSRRFYWQYNHPMPIAEGVAQKIAPGLKNVTNPTEKAMLGLAIAAPVASTMGTFDLTNPGEMFRPRGYAQKYSEKGSDDRRETAQPGIELIDRFVLGRQGPPLKYDTAKEEIPDLTKERYSKVMRNYYQDKGLLGLGLVKATDENIVGEPEARIVGFPVGLQTAGAVVGGGLGARYGLEQVSTPAKVGNQNINQIAPRMSTRRAAAITALGATAGAALGTGLNRLIASARNNPENLPDTLEYSP